MGSFVKWEVRRALLRMDGVLDPVIEQILADEQLAEYRTRAASEPAPDAAAPVSDVGAKDDSPQALTTPQMADAFEGIDGQTAKQWREKLGDTKNHQWLLPALHARGSAPTPSTWWPLEFARVLQGRGATFENLNGAFLTVPVLKRWLPEWQEAHRERNAFGR